MSLHDYLVSLASSLRPTDSERGQILTSVKTIFERLDQNLGDELKDLVGFGSFPRGTMLTRSVDQHSDVDLMIVFNKSDSKPQTYLNRLKQFAEGRYPLSEVRQSRPSIVLEMNHLSFDLVPAIDRFIGGISIPSSSDDWMSAGSDDTYDRLRKLNVKHRYFPGMAILLCKYWNVLKGYELDSYQIEKSVMEVAGWEYCELAEMFIRSLRMVVEQHLKVPSPAAFSERRR
ncbi:MAG: nucleotidyltransferase domain-containing protein [Bacilli bacterium]